MFPSIDGYNCRLIHKRKQKFSHTRVYKFIYVRACMFVRMWMYVWILNILLTSNIY